MKKRKINLKLAILFLIITIAMMVLGLFSITKLQDNKIERLESKIELLKEVSTPIRFKVIDRNNGVIHFAIKFYDLDGNVIKREEFRLKGDELSFDFYVIPIKDRYIAFPHKIFTNKIAPKNGKNILNFYDKNGFPQIFNSKNLDEDIKRGLQELFLKLKTKNIEELEGLFGSGIQDIKDINEFEKDNIYKIITHTKGGIEIVSE